MMQIKVHHRIITPDCRRNKGDEGALAEALETATAAVRQLYGYWPIEKGALIHIKVEVEYD